MANPGYVRSTDGDNADDGSTWALANADLANAMADQSAGDRIWVSDNHAESTAASVTITMPGTVASPNQVLCGDDTAEPPTALATTGTVTTTGANTLTVRGTGYIYGLTFSAGNNLVIADAVNNLQIYDNCDLVLTTNSSTPRIQVGLNANGEPSEVEWKNTDVKFANAGQKINIINTMFRWKGGSLLSGGTSPTALIQFGTNRGANAQISGVDLVNAAAGIDLIEPSAAAGLIVFRNCKLPASWSGTLINGTPEPGFRAEMHNCDDGDTNYTLWVEDYAGSIRDETTIVRSGGASDGTTSIAWKLATTANAEFPTVVLRSPEIIRWNETLSSITATVEFVHDSLTNLQDDEIWLEVEYLGTSGFPLALFADDAVDIIGTPSDQTDSSESWTTTGLTNPNTQKLSVTFTPAEKGLLRARVVMAVASYTAYIDPKLTIS